MGHVVLWACSLATALLLVATLLAVTVRWPRRYGQTFWPILAGALVLALACAASVLAGYLEFRERLDVSRFYPVVVWTALYLAGSATVLVGGLRRREGAAAASGWRRGPLAAALAGITLLTVGTFAYLDWAARSRLASLRAEAGAKALTPIAGPLAARDNAAALYREAFAVLKQTERDPHAPWEQIWNRREIHADDLDPHHPALRTYVDKLQDGLELLRRAAAQPGCSFDRDLSRGVELDNAELRQLHYAARVLALDGLVCEGRGDVSKALDDVVAIYRMARQIDEPILIPQLVAARIEEIGGQTLEAVLGKTVLSAEDLRRLDLPSPPGYVERMLKAMEGEEVAMGLSSFQTLTEGSSPSGNLKFDLWVGSAEPRVWLANPLYRVFYLEQDVAAYQRTLAEMRALGARPYHQADADWRALDQELRGQRRGMLTGMIKPDGRSCVQRAIEADARVQLARLAIAVCRYRCNTGSHPDPLAQLVPDYLSALPADPCDGQPLRARRLDDGLLLYSVGIDLTVDGGAAWNPATRSGDLVLRMR